jgi:hypothetical protein
MIVRTWKILTAASTNAWLTRCVELRLYLHQPGWKRAGGTGRVGRAKRRARQLTAA